jgi:hypothetical protein
MGDKNALVAVSQSSLRDLPVVIMLGARSSIYLGTSSPLCDRLHKHQPNFFPFLLLFLGLSLLLFSLSLFLLVLSTFQSSSSSFALFLHIFLSIFILFLVSISLLPIIKMRFLKLTSVIGFLIQAQQTLCFTNPVRENAADPDIFYAHGHYQVHVHILTSK